MKRFLLIAIVVWSIVGVQPAQAHEILPASVIQYIRDNPKATPTEVQEFIQRVDPSAAKKFTDPKKVSNLIETEKRPWLLNFLVFIQLGIQHILMGPDHILFVLSLLLSFVVMKDIVKMVSGFTVAHSLTFFLAGTGFLTLSSRLVEPLIALSISYVALTTVFLKHKRFFSSGRAKVATIFFFGLFHGLGFGGLLKEIQIPSTRYISSLVGFNLGIEVGQLIIIAVVVPLLYVSCKKPWYALAVKTVAVTIGSIGLFWAVERIFGL